MVQDVIALLTLLGLGFVILVSLGIIGFIGISILTNLVQFVIPTTFIDVFAVVMFIVSILFASLLLGAIGARSIL